MEEVSEFIVIAPAGQGKAVTYAERSILSHLAALFPYYSFRIEAFGPYMKEDEFTIIPIMNRRSRPGESTAGGVMYMCKPLDPRVIPEIREALRKFWEAPVGVN